MTGRRMKSRPRPGRKPFETTATNNAQLSSGSEGYAVVSVSGLPELRTAPPADSDGPSAAWSPEHLLSARRRGDLPPLHAPGRCAGLVA
jgi:hypothetical protein